MTMLRRIRRQVLFAAAHLVLTFVPSPSLWAAPPPAAVKTASREVLVIRAGTVRCLGAPIAASLLLTANHCADGPQVSWEARDGRRGTASVVLRRVDRDLVLARVDGPVQFAFWLRPARALPEEVETVWARFLIPRTDVVALVEGNFVAEVTLGGDRHCVLVDGLSGPGSSGGVLLNARGEVVAIHSQSWNPGLEVAIERGFLTRPLAIYRSVVGVIG